MRCVQLARRFAPSDWGGTETVVLETSKRLLELGCRTEVVCTTATDPRPQDVIDGVPVTRFPYFYPYLALSAESRKRLDKKGGSPFSFQLMGRLAMMPDLDLIHSHVGNRIGGIGRFVAERRNIPYVVSLHGGVFDVPPEEAATMVAPSRGSLEWGKVLGMLVGSRRYLEDAAAIICVGHRERELAQERFPDKRVVHLPNGVDAALFKSGDGPAFRRAYNIPQDAFVLVTVARIDGQKNQRLLLEVLPRLLAAHPKAHVLLVGSPTSESYHEGLLQLCAETGMREHVTIVAGLPVRSQALVDAYHAADVFVLPSIHEPFGIAILEAWASGLPVIAARVGGVPYFVKDGDDGLLFESKDGEGLLAHAKTLAASPQRRRALSETGRTKACEHYSWEHVTRLLLNEYERAIRARRRRR